MEPGFLKVARVDILFKASSFYLINILKQLLIIKVCGETVKFVMHKSDIT